MNNLINIENKKGILRVSSWEVADRFNKEHYHVTDVIENKIKILTHEKSGVRMTDLFIEGTFDHKRNSYKEYSLIRDGFSFIVMGFTGLKADIWKLKYIEVFNKIESEIKNRSLPTGENLIALALGEADKMIRKKDNTIKVRD